MKLFLLHYALYLLLFVAFGQRKPSEKARDIYQSRTYRLSGALQKLDSPYFTMLNDSEWVLSQDANTLLRFNLNHQGPVTRYTFPELREAAVSFHILSISQDQNQLVIYGEIKNRTASKEAQKVLYTLSKDFKYARVQYLKIPKNAEIVPFPEHGFWIHEDTLFSGTTSLGPRHLLKGCFYRKSSLEASTKKELFLGKSSIQFKKLMEKPMQQTRPQELPYLRFRDNRYMSVYNTICDLRSEKLLFAVDSSKEILNFSIDPTMGTLLVATGYHHKDSAGVYQLHAYSFPERKALHAPVRIKNENLLKIDIQHNRFYLFGKDQEGYFVNQETFLQH